MLTGNDLGVKVDIGDCGLGQNFMYAELYCFLSLNSTNII